LDGVVHALTGVLFFVLLRMIGTKNTTFYYFIRVSVWQKDRTNREGAIANYSTSLQSNHETLETLFKRVVHLILSINLFILIILIYIKI